MRRPRALALVALTTLTLVGFSFSAVAGSSWRTRLAEVLQREIGLTRNASDLSRALAELDRERSSLEYTVAVLDHSSRESMRRLDVYREVRSDREQIARQRARALYELSRGGVSRMIFEERLDPNGKASTDDRVSKGRLLGFLVRTDLRELAVHRRAEQRASSELVAASREIQALGAITMVHAMTEHVLVSADRHVDQAIDETKRQRRSAMRGAGDRGLERNRKLLSLLQSNWRELRNLEGLDGAERLVRPVRGPVVGAFGLYEDRVLRLPMSRNGVELRARRGERVRAMADGRVALITELPGFEQVLVIDHGGGQYALLGRLWQIEVTEGQEVEAGDTVGRVAAKTTDDGLGTTVYVELRHGEKPVDPTPYLRRTQQSRPTAEDTEPPEDEVDEESPETAEDPSDLE